MAEICFEQKDIPHGEESGIGSLSFRADEIQNGLFLFGAYMNPDDEIVDADEGDFPQFDCEITREQLGKLHALIGEALE